MTTYQAGDKVRHRRTRWSRIVGTVTGVDPNGIVAVNWHLGDWLVATGRHNPANIEPRPR